MARMQSSTYRVAAGVALTALAAAIAATTTAEAATVKAKLFDGIAIFGDSLSDDGNIALATKLPNYTGTASLQRFTTNPGTVGVENVAAAFGLATSPSLLGGNDFAFGGAGVTTNSPGTPSTVPTVTTQITGYLAANPKLDPKTLYTVFGGANDIFYHATAAGASAIAAQRVAALPAGLPAATVAALTAQINAGVAAAAGVSALETSTQAGQAVLAAAGQEVTLITALHNAGAKYVVVFNLPDIGLTPQAAAQDAAAPGTAASLTLLSSGYNTVLDSGLKTIGTGIVPVNSFLLLHEVAANPTAFGLTNVTTPACTTASSLTCTQNTLRALNAASTYLFADGVHPTTAGHAIFSQSVIAELNAPAYISLLAEAPLAFSSAQRSQILNELAIDSTDATATAGTRVFASGGYGLQTFSSGAYTQALRDEGENVTIGFDMRVNPQLTAGASLTYGDSNANFQDGAGKFRTQELLGTIFGQYQFFDHAYVNAAVGFGGIDYRNVQRIFALGQEKRLEKGATSGSDITGTLTGGYWFGLDNLYRSLKVGPYASLQYERVRVDAYGEDGGDSTAMTFGAQTREALVGEFGVRAQASIATPYVTLQPFLQAAYDYDGRADTRSVSAGLTTLGGTFSMPGYTPSDSWGTVQAGVNAKIAERFSVYAAYQGRFSDDSQRSNAFNVGAKYAF